MPKGADIPHVKRVRSKGRDYYYFNTGVRNSKGATIYKRLPDIRAPEFGDVLAAFKAGRTRRQSIAPMLTLESFIDMYERSSAFADLAASTRRVYTIHLRALEKAFPEAPAEELESSDVAAMLGLMGNAKGAINLRLSVVNALYKWGRKKKIIHPDCEPGKGLEMEKMGEHDPWPEPILNAALKSDKARVRLATHLLFYTGQRIGDVCALRWSDIRNGHIEMVQQKTGKELSIPIHSALDAILEQSPRRALTILTSHDGKPIQQNAIRMELQAFVKEQFGVKIVPHGLRKNAVNALLEADCSVAQTAAITGQTLQMVEHYAKGRNQRKLAGAAILKWERNAR